MGKQVQIVSLIFLIIAAIALAVQGLVPLQADAYSAKVLARQSVTHTRAVQAFWLCTVAHFCTALYSCMAAEHDIVKTSSIAMKATFLTLMIFFQVVVHKALDLCGILRDAPARAIFQVDAVFERLGLLMLMAFVMSYACDLHGCPREEVGDTLAERHWPVPQAA